ncbi:MAG TPA: DUF433 domain-containing protein [Thermoguttaceae bacterium]|nr:DUF433 domain-containing protein [Thermoguttaceae bacterium]
MAKSKSDIYGGRDPLDVPAYTLRETAHCLQLPVATVRAWAVGRSYPVASGERTAQPLIRIADGATPAFSFRNVVELHVLGAIRRRHKVQMSAVRRAIAFLQRQLNVPCPLADQQMTTDGKDLFIERYGRLVNISRGGQLEMKSVVETYLSRIERDPAGLPIRLFPFTRPRIEEAPRLVALDPRLQFGRPCIAGTGIPTSIIGERYRAGDSIGDLAKDYGQETLAIEEALRYEFATTAA